MAEAQTNDAALAEGLGAGFPQFPIPIAREKIPEVSAKTELKDLPLLYQQAAQRQMEVNQNLAQIDAAQKALSASKQAEISSRDLQDYEKNLAEKKRKEDQFPYPSFHPTQENAFSLGQIFSMIATAAVSMGNIGKVGGMGALGAMTGMLQGWRQGRIDLFNREKQEFDKKVNEIKLARDAIQKDWNDYLALRVLKVEEARAKLNELLSKVGQNSIIAANIAKGDLNAVNNFLNGVSNVVYELEKQKRHSEEMEQRRQDRLSREAESRAFRLEMARLKASGKKSSLSPQQQSFEDMVSISLNEAAAQVENLATMKFATTGFWQGRNTKGLLDAPLGVLTNTLTTEDVQRYNAVIGIIGREAAKVFAGGRIITDKAAEDFAGQFKVREGDKPFTVLEKMANIRQFFERAIQVKQARPDVNLEMQQIYINALNSFRNSIPITNKEVNEAKRQADQKKGKTKTFGQIMGEMEKSGETKVSPDVTPSTSKAMPSGERLKAYADANWKGNEADAKQYLQSQGYK